MTNVSLTVTRADGLAKPADFNEVKSYWGVGLIIVAWDFETLAREIDPASARAETNKNQLIVSYATKPSNFPEGANIATMQPFRLEFIVRDIPHTNYVITVKKR